MRLITWNIIDSRSGNLILACQSNHHARCVQVSLNRGLPDKRYAVKLTITERCNHG